MSTGIILGTCSRCRGPVTVSYNSSCLPPEPSCARCHAIPESPYGPIIQMVPQYAIVVAEPRARGD